MKWLSDKKPKLVVVGQPKNNFFYNIFKYKSNRSKARSISASSLSRRARIFSLVLGAVISAAVAATAFDVDDSGAAKNVTLFRTVFVKREHHLQMAQLIWNYMFYK